MRRLAFAKKYGDTQKIQGEPAIIGYPRQEGMGIYAVSWLLYVNSSSSCKESVKEFLQYLISEEEQGKYIDYSRLEGESVEGSIPVFPVHLGAYEKLMELAQADMSKGAGMSNGVYYDRHPLTDEQVEQLYFIVENIHSSNFKSKAIDAIVEEELAPYFAGDITAEQAATVLDNRVQLYLDERGELG